MRLIDADKLKRKAQKCATEAWKMNLTARIETVLNQFIDWIDEAPTVEPERKKGKWIRITQGAIPEIYICPFCNRTLKDTGIDSLVQIRYPFCHCGADMRGEEDT